jgi:lipopolysaccharide transport system ATP-binding protein
MSDVAVRAENLSKLYRVGEYVGYQTLRESLMKTLISPFRKKRLVDSDSEYIWALKDVSFEIKRGEVVGIIGRNGAGKSTLLKILTRITTPTEGYAEISGPVGSLLEVGTGFHPELTGRENIYLNGAVLGMKKREIDRKFKEIVEFSGVEKFIDTPLKRYSSGMQVRLAFAVAAHLEPEVLLVDEVLAVGDAEFQKRSLGKMNEVAREGRTVLFVSHNITAILQLCHRTILLDEGKLVEYGDTQKVTSRYLSDDFIPLGEVTIPCPSQANTVTLLGASIRDEAMQVRQHIANYSPFCIIVEYRVKTVVDKLRIGIRLYNERGLAVLHTATSDYESLATSVGIPGVHRVWVQIPGALLAPGRYYIDIGAWSPQVGHHHLVRSALGFVITNESMDSIGDEVLRPVLKWTME